MQKLLIITQKVDKNDQLLGFFVDWITVLDQKFEKVTVLCLEKGEFSLPRNVKVLSLGKGEGASKFGQLFNFYKQAYTLKDDYDSVFVHMNPIWVILGGLMWRLMNKKIFFWYTSGGVTAKLKLAEKFADTIFTASKESFRLPSKKIIVTGHGIDTDLFKPNSKFKIQNSKLMILSVGRIAPVKNYEVLVDAAKILKDKGLDFLVTMIGEAPLERDKDYEQVLKLKIKKLKLEDNFNFIGKVINRDLPRYYQSHDLFIHLSRTGSLDKTLMEAMSCGMNVLSSNDAARCFLPSELIFYENNVQELAEKIEKTSRESFRGQSREYVIKNHNLPELIEKISRIIKGAIFKNNKILVSGYTYVDGGTLKTFDYYPGVINFLVPKIWPLKGGKYIYRAPENDNIRRTKAFFTHSDYPIIGGIFKGFMPIFPFELIRQKPDVVFSASELNLLTTFYQGFFAKLYGAKHVIFTWETIFYKNKFKGFKGIVQRFIIGLNLMFCDGLVCGSVRAQKMIESLTDKPTAVIPLSGIDTEYLSRNYSKKLFRGTDFSNDIVFCFMGAIGYRKGIHLIIKAFEEISKTIVNTRLLVAGSGEYDKEIDLMIKEAGLGERIIRFPWLERNEVRELLNSSDIFLYPSIPYGGWEEQFGYSLLEASSMELPIITTESGSISEVVLNEKTGILIKADDSVALKEAMLVLVNDNQKRISMGKAGREFIENTYSNQIVAEKYHRFFNSFHNSH